jgi:hypothetical protein
MKALLKPLATSAAILFALIASFIIGRWSGDLMESLSNEATYPWALHKKIALIDAGCAELRKPQTMGKFIVTPTDNGETLLIAALNNRSGKVSAFAVTFDGQFASDSWSVDCK